MAKRKKRTAVIGLDVGSTAVKAVALRRHGDVLTITGCARIGIAEVDEPVQAVRRVLRQGGFKANRIVAGIAGRGVMLQTVNIALDENRDLDDAILDEAEKLLPYDPDEAELDYQILPESAGGRISALLAAVRKRDAEKRLEILQSAGVRPERLDAEAVALANGFETANAGGYFVPEGATVALVDFGAAKTLIAVTDGAEYLFREFPVGGTALTEMIAQRLGCGLDEAERLKLDPGEKIDTVKDAIYPGIEDITAEIRTCIENFKTVNDGRQAETTLLSGGLVRFAGIPPLIGRLTKTRAGVFNLFGAFESSDMETATAPYSLDYSIAFGLACHARE